MTSRAKMFLLAFAISLLAAKAQITIGSNDAPASAALLQIKQNELVGSNALGGLGLPRVQLVDMKKLQPMYSYTGTDQPSAADLLEHTGLVVYNLSGTANKECAKIPHGLYVWDGSQWLGVPKTMPAGGLKLSPNTLTFYTANPQDVQVSWGPSGGGIAPPTYTPPADITVDPSSGTWTGTTTSPQTVSVTPTVFPTKAFDVTTTTVPFAFDVCGQNETLTLKLINKSLFVNGLAKPYTVEGQLGKNTTTMLSNAKWVLTSIIPSIGSPITSTVPAIGVEGGIEYDDGGSITTPFVFNINTAAGNARYNYLTFSDASSPKRFDDIVLTVRQCSTNSDFTMEEYRNLWEILFGVDPDNYEKDSNGNTELNTNKVQWHTDQDGNIFFSSVFGKDSQGNENRWMINNLAAKKYTDAFIASHSPAAITQGTAVNAMAPYWTTVATLRSLEREGILYNYTAATGNATPGAAVEKIQGICPDGWHLPTNAEYQALYTEVAVTNPTKYANATSGIGGKSVLKDECESIASTIVGVSLEMLRGGFSFMLVGTSAGSFDGYLWNSSGATYTWGMKGLFSMGDFSRSTANLYSRGDFVSVRCKKN